jgi:RNA polymerase sigma-70 factor (ECF subfamily)
MSDEAFPDLIRRIRAGDERAAEEVLRRYEPTIRRIVRVRLGDARLQRQLDAEDICQSVFGSFFVRAALGQYELDGPEQLLKLLVNMSRKKVIDQVREAGAARRDYRRARGGEALERTCADPQPSPSEHVASQELLLEFRKRLSADERQLAEARADGRDWKEIAAAQGGSPEALRKKLARAIDRVSHELGLEQIP